MVSIHTVLEEPVIREIMQTDTRLAQKYEKRRTIIAFAEVTA